MNVDTGQMGNLADVLRDAQPGERVIPATIIPAPSGKYAKRRAMSDPAPMVPTEREMPPVYGPRKPLREIRAELQAAKATTEA